MSNKVTNLHGLRQNRIKRNLELVSKSELDHSEILELLPPGSFATIKNQPNDLPPFQIINCKGGRCWIRQQSWGKFVHWEIAHHRLKSA